MFDFVPVIVSILPVVFYVWAGMLLSWGSYCFYHVLKSDAKLLCCPILFFELILIFAVFIDPASTHNLIEIFITITFWYTMLLIYTKNLIHP